MYVCTRISRIFPFSVICLIFQFMCMLCFHRNYSSRGIEIPKNLFNIKSLSLCTFPIKEFFPSDSNIFNF